MLYKKRKRKQTVDADEGRTPALVSEVKNIHMEQKSTAEEMTKKKRRKGERWREADINETKMGGTKR